MNIGAPSTVSYRRMQGQLDAAYAAIGPIGVDIGYRSKYSGTSMLI